MKSLFGYPGLGMYGLTSRPENLEFYVMKSFHNFTEGTAKVYEFEDKLRYLDNLRKSLHAGSTDEHVRRLVCKRVEHRMEEGDFPDRKDFLCIEFRSTVLTKDSCHFMTPIILEAKAETRSVCVQFYGLSARL